MVYQIEFTLSAHRRGFHLVTAEIMRHIPQLPEQGLLHLFIKHTSCGLSLNENADPDVRSDMNMIFDTLIPENNPRYKHTLEGSDDMPAHAKSTITGTSLCVPISHGKLNLGTWQGIYLCEFRNDASPRKIVATIIS